MERDIGRITEIFKNQRDITEDEADWIFSFLEMRDPSLDRCLLDWYASVETSLKEKRYGNFIQTLPLAWKNESELDRTISRCLELLWPEDRIYAYYYIAKDIPASVPGCKIQSEETENYRLTTAEFFRAGCIRRIEKNVEMIGMGEDYTDKCKAWVNLHKNPLSIKSAKMFFFAAAVEAAIRLKMPVGVAFFYRNNESWFGGAVCSDRSLYSVVKNMLEADTNFIVKNMTRKSEVIKSPKQFESIFQDDGRFITSQNGIVIRKNNKCYLVKNKSLLDAAVDGYVDYKNFLEERKNIGKLVDPSIFESIR